MAKRGEYRSIEEARDAGKGQVPTEAILADRPIYKGGQILRPWQKRFVQTCVEDHRFTARPAICIADDVGLGKTLSMAAAALVLSMLDDTPGSDPRPRDFDLAVAGGAGGQARHSSGGLVDAEEMLARQRGARPDPKRRSDAGSQMPMAHRHRVDRPHR